MLKMLIGCEKDTLQLICRDHKLNADRKMGKDTLRGIVVSRFEN